MKKWSLRVLRLLYIGLIASLPVAALANYAATVGAGTNFGSIVIGGVHFVSELLCDATTANQCAGVNASGQVAIQAPPTLPLPTGAMQNTGGSVSLTGTSPVSVAAGQIVNGGDVVLGNNTDAASCASGTSLIACQRQTDLDVKAPLAAGTNSIGTIAGNVNVTPTNCSGTITTGGTAQNAFAATATIHGFTIANIDSTAGSGEPLWISFTTTAAASTAASYPLSAPTATTFTGLSSFTSPLGFGLNTALSIVGATTGHKFSCTTW